MRAPDRWREPCASTECSLHQISPYVGKLKSSIAAELIERYSKPGQLVVDPFAGAGTIPLEAALRGRRVFGSDISPYARVLSRAKLFPPRSAEEALAKAVAALRESERLPRPDLRAVPMWVRRFFHPRTLAEVVNFSRVCRGGGDEFLLACLLGILHHQRPGFLSYPSSHLVPYLRDKKYPRDTFPEMYSYRPLRPRLLAKVERVYSRFSCPKPGLEVRFRQSALENLRLPVGFDCLITSPPYMNALDYGRDNRLRLWFIDPKMVGPVDNGATRRRESFVSAMRCLADKTEAGLTRRGYCVVIVGETLQRTFMAHPSDIVRHTIEERASRIRLKRVIVDDIPDIRRTRREYRGVKREHFLIFQKD